MKSKNIKENSVASVPQRQIEELNKITEKIIAAAIEVHQTLGPGLLESIYEKALAIELGKQKLAVETQKELPVQYKGIPVGNFRVDIVVEGKIVLELKSVERHDPVFEAQLLSYLKMGDYPLGLLINFNNELLKQGIKRIILTKP